MSLTLPGVEDRTIIIGPTGSGKTYAGLWILANMPLDLMPWVIVDYKRDKQIAQIPFAQEIPIGYLPESSGVYVVRPLHTQVDEMEQYLMGIWDHENIGLYIDEGVMLSRSDALDTILIQGRSKHIPVIMLTQRPVGISRYAFSESQFRMLFPNDDRREQKIISEFMPLFRDRNSRDADIPEFHSYYYNVKKRELSKLKPVPNLSRVLHVFDAKLRPPEPLEKIPDNRVRITKI